MANRSPTYRLKILNKATNEKCNDAGCGWQNKDGSITLQLSPFIDWKVNKNDFVLTLFIIGDEK